MKKIDVALKNQPYSVYFLDSFSGFPGVRSFFEGYDKIAVITDDKVASLYLNSFLNLLRPINKNLVSFVFPNGEPSKNIETAMEAISFLAQNGFHRNDLVVALGGGVVGDLSGFVASIYMRGIPFVQVPTTLLAMVDASIGGKTAIDIAYGKNLVGSFHQPKAVLVFQNILEDMDERLFIEGSSEVIKYGVIYDSTILERCAAGLKEHKSEIVERCVKAKCEIVAEDEKETGLRKILNYGHTMAHAIEECSKHEISHGYAVAYGMRFAAFLAEKKSFAPRGFLAKLDSLIGRLMDLQPLSFSSEDLVFFMKNDKKNAGDGINFVLSNGAENRVFTFSVDETRGYLDEFLK